MEHLPTPAILFLFPLLPHSHNLLTIGAVYHFLYTQTVSLSMCSCAQQHYSKQNLYLSGHPITATMLTNMIKGTSVHKYPIILIFHTWKWYIMAFQIFK